MERGIAQAVEEDARDEGPLVVDRGLLLDDRRPGVTMSRTLKPVEVMTSLSAAECPRESRSQRRSNSRFMRRTTSCGVAVEGQIVGRREEEALGAVAVDAQLLQERGVGRRVEEVAQRADLPVLQALGHVEARPALGERDADAAPPGAALEPRDELPRGRVVGEQVLAGDDGPRAPGDAQPEREQARAARRALPPPATRPARRPRSSAPRVTSAALPLPGPCSAG